MPVKRAFGPLLDQSTPFRRADKVKVPLLVECGFQGVKVRVSLILDGSGVAISPTGDAGIWDCKGI
jgi:ribosomal protein S3